MSALNLYAIGIKYYEGSLRLKRESRGAGFLEGIALFGINANVFEMI